MDIFHDRGDIGAGIDHQRDAKTLQRLHPAPLDKRRVRLPVGVDINRDAWRRRRDQRHQPLELGQRKMRRTKTDSRERRPVRHGRQPRDRRIEIGCGDWVHRIRRFALQRRVQCWRFGRQTDRMEHGNAAGRCRDRAKRFQIILGGLWIEANDNGNQIAGTRTDDRADGNRRALGIVGIRRARLDRKH